jgi:putative ABC transport system ATP-binding protein
MIRNSGGPAGTSGLFAHNAERLHRTGERKASARKLKEQHMSELISTSFFGKRGVDVPHDPQIIESAVLSRRAECMIDKVGRCSDDRMRRTIALETRNLTRTVGGKVLVNDIAVQVSEGEILAVIGRSGSGKSSFLRLLNRLDEPTGGIVILNGQDYRDIAPRKLRRRVGMVMQTAYLFPGTVAANVGFGPQQHGEALSPGQIAALLERVGGPGDQDRDVSNLSGGEAQRVSLARTLANSPEVLLLDEPTSALDDVSARGIEELVLSIVRELKMTCVIVTHAKLQAARIANRTMRLEAGSMIAIGPTNEVLHAD